MHVHLEPADFTQCVRELPQRDDLGGDLDVLADPLLRVQKRRGDLSMSTERSRVHRGARTYPGASVGRHETREGLV